MGQLGTKLRRAGRPEGYTANGLAHWCPACREMHQYALDGPNSSGARWTWDGNVERPTFNPSMNIRTNPVGDPHYQWQAMSSTCHYFLHNGQIQYLSDCTHALAGRTIDMPELPAHLRDNILTDTQNSANSATSQTPGGHRMPESESQNAAADVPLPFSTPATDTPPKTESLPDSLLDGAVLAATPLVEEAAVSLRDKLVAEGHAIIDKHLGAAKHLADLQPVLRPLLPLISACLHDLFAHMTSAQPAAPEAPPPAGMTLEQVKATGLEMAAASEAPVPAPTPLGSAAA